VLLIVVIFFAAANIY